MNFRYNMLKRIIESNNPNVSLNDVLLLTLSYLDDGTFDKAQFDELSALVANTGTL